MIMVCRVYYKQAQQCLYCVCECVCPVVDCAVSYLFAHSGGEGDGDGNGNIIAGINIYRAYNQLSNHSVFSPLSLSTNSESIHAITLVTIDLFDSIVFPFSPPANLFVNWIGNMFANLRMMMNRNQTKHWKFDMEYGKIQSSQP